MAKLKMPKGTLLHWFTQPTQPDHLVLAVPVGWRYREDLGIPLIEAVEDVEIEVPMPEFKPHG